MKNSKTKKPVYEEIEVKFLNIDPKKIQQKLLKLGAKKVFEKTYRRKIYDHPDLRLDQKGAWVRLRDEGEKITLTFKQRLGIKDNEGNDDGVEEIEFEVSDFDKAQIFLERIELKEKGYQENKRIRYMLGNIEVDIDYWPLLNPYLEIEAKSWKDIDKAIKLLELNPKDKKIFSTMQVYKLVGINTNDYHTITFEKQLKK